MLKASQLNVYYGQSHTIRNVSLNLGQNEAIAIMGRNGMGKTTLLKAMIGMLPVRSGTITLAGEEIQAKPSYDRVAKGLAFVPQGRMIFPLMSVRENILTGLETTQSREIPDYIHRYFPVLKEMEHRKGGNLSGGQQQMLAIARALVSNPKVLILDEPTEGIQPSIIKELARTLVALRQERNVAILVSEQVLSFALEVADRFLVIDRGEIVNEKKKGDVDLEDIRHFLTV
ncbi:urea ABC transporter ATP-binding subunit UrtE [Allopusillimonas ginsengisoli]|uniref:urea ABC transporter ATP-binding subunit UrtE n=1 Tax=Allopusillimonas ginsengisoli TaxID=453575 RepID=UPI0010C15B97|nr:urea ABC transporter ATP-binding subunit UrtE [Allopusillimonas ginsengisoli]